MPERLGDAPAALVAADLLDLQAVARRSRRPTCAGTARSPGRRCSRRARSGGRPLTSRPPSSTRPPSGRSKPAISRRQVVLPEPDGPSIVKNSSARMSRSMPSTATTFAVFLARADAGARRSPRPGHRPFLYTLEPTGAPNLRRNGACPGGRVWLSGQRLRLTRARSAPARIRRRPRQAAPRRRGGAQARARARDRSFRAARAARRLRYAPVRGGDPAARRRHGARHAGERRRPARTDRRRRSRRGVGAGRMVRLRGRRARGAAGRCRLGALPHPGPALARALRHRHRSGRRAGRRAGHLRRLARRRRAPGALPVRGDLEPAPRWAALELDRPSPARSSPTPS